jgi:PAS domain S-box-containing protein
MTAPVKKSHDAESITNTELEDILHTMIETLIVVDRDGFITRANEATFDLLGYTKHELSGMHVHTILVEKEAQEKLEKLEKEQKATIFETTYVTKDGGCIPVNLSASPMKNKKGNPKGVMCVAEDITERKRAEEELHRRSDELAALNDIAMMVTNSLNLLEVLRSIQEHVLSTLREPYPPVFALFDEETQLFRVEVTHVRKKVLDELNKLLGMNLDDLVFSAKDPKRTAIREAIVAGKPYLTADGSDLLGSRIAKMLVAGAQRAFGVKCFVIVPLKAKDKLVGVMAVFSQKEKMPVEEINFLLALGNHAAIAIDNARLYEAAQRDLEALLKSERNYRDLVNYTHEAIVLAQDGYLKFANPRSAELSGYSVEELMSTPFVEFIHPDDQARVVEHYERMLKGEKLLPVDPFRIITKEGEVWWIAFNSVLVDWEGRPGALYFLSDITERKRAEDELCESEERYRNLVERAGDGITIIQDTKVKYANPSLVKRWGGTVDEVIDTSFTNYISPEELSPITEYYKRHVAGKDVPHIYETVLQCKDGTKVPVELNAGSITYQDKPADFVVIRDIIERKQAEEQLKLSEEKFRSLFDGGPDPSYVLNKDGIFEDVNKNIVDVIGYTREELIGKHFLESAFLTEESKQKLVENFKNRMQDEHVPPYEIEVITRNGEQLFAELNVKPLLREGKIVGEIGIARNITDRKRFEAKLQASLCEKEELMREIHHRVKNNLQIISSLLNMQVRRATNEEVVESLSDSQSRIHAMALIHTQLYQSKNFGQVEMGSTIQRLVDYLMGIHAKRERSISTVVTIKDIILPISQAIPCALIINELVSNSFKHAFKNMKKGRINVSIHELGDDTINLIVKDNGGGIPEDFDPFGSETLGLKLVISMVENQLKGTIKQTRNEGTVISIEIPKTMSNEN